MNSTSLAHPIDIGIFAVFLIITLVVGLRYGRSVKTLKDYALGGKNFSTFTLTATIVATWMGGDAIFYIVTNVYKGGLYFIIPILGWVACIVLTGQLAARMGEFLNNISVAEAMRDLYGKSAHIITAVFGILSCIGCIAIQLKVTAMVITLMWGFTGLWVMVLAGVIVITYSALGGIKSVTYTDVFQFLTFGTFIPIIALVIWNNLKSPNMVIYTLTHTSVFSFTEVMGWNTKFMGAIALLAFFVTPSMDPAIFQRIAMGRNVRQTKQAFSYAAVPFLLILLFMIWISVLLLSSDHSLPPDDLVSYIVHQYAHPGLRGLFGTGIVAMAMSTSDSYINASAVLLSNDIAKPLNIATQHPIRTARLFAVVGGGLALMIAINTEDLLELALLPGSFYMPVVTVPLVMAIFGFRSSTRAAMIGIILGFTTALVWKIFLDQTEITSIFPGMLANLIGLMGSHYMFREKGGWQQLAPDSPLALERAARRQAWQRRLNAIRSFRLYPYLQHNLPSQEGFYFFFGLYTIAATYTAFYTVGNVESQAYRAINTGIYYTVLPVITAFLTLAIWPDSLKKSRFIAFFWPLGIGGILFFAGMLLVIMSHFHHMQVMVMMINLLMAVLLLRWPLALFLAFTGTALAVSFFKHYTGTPLPTGELAGSLQLKIIYGLLLFTSFLIALFKGKHAYNRLSTSHEQLREERSASSIELIEALHHRERLVREVTTDKAEAIVTIKQMRKKLDDALNDATTKEQLGVVNQDFQATLDKLHLLTEYLDQVTYQTQGYMRLEASTVSLSGLLNDVFDSLGKQDPMFAKQVLTQQHTTDQTLQADIGKLKQLLVDSLYYAQQHKQENMPILLSIEETSLGYPISAIQDHVKEVSALCFIITTASTLPTPSTLYMVSVDRAAIRLPKDATELPITHNQQIVEAHYGTSEFIESERGITQMYVIPVRVREVRPQTMDLLSATEIMSDTAVYPEEVAFVKVVTEKTQVDMAMLQKALQLIKKHHAGVKRKSGEPFYLHPIAVAKILLEYTQEEDTIIAALLHDTVEDTSLSLAQVALIFNPVVTTIVDGVTHLDSNLKNFKRIQLSAHENIQQLLEVKDERILYVKLADRLHNMRTIEGHSSLANQQRIAKETLQFFVPMAKSIGLVPIAEELKRRSFAVLNVK
ncbi:MAG: hypothetical protein RL012_502 [Bacteroidota bacterium]|jgi:Na+/proline symporter